MRQYTTPTLVVTIKYKNGEIASDFDFDYLIFSVANNKRRLDKKVMFADVVEGVFHVKFTQNETGAFEGTDNEYQLNFFVGDARTATSIKHGKMQRNLLNEVIIE